jgi:hypothetical protein
VRALVVGCLVAVLSACATNGPEIDPRLELPFSGPGRLVVLWHLGDPDDPPNRHLVVYDADGARPVEVEDVREVRWLDARTLLVAQEVPAGDPAELPQTRLLRVRLATGGVEPIAKPRRYYNAEPSADGRWLAVGEEVNDQGDSALEIWLLARGGATRMRRREQNLDEPRWSPESDALAVAMMVEPDADADGQSLGVAGVTVPWPRLFVLDAGFADPALPVHDGARDRPPTAGGSLPLFWTRAGLHARQRGGLVRCASPESGCELVVENPPGRRLADARPFAKEGAFLLLVDATSEELNPLASEIWTASLATGSAGALFPARPGAWPLDLDWSPAPPDPGP